MATYTMQLRKVCDIYTRDEVEKWFKSYEISDFLTPTQIEQINKFNVWNKDKLAKKIVDHYFMREIGFETPYLFRHFVITTMNEIMERYLPKIYSNFLEYDPLSNVDFTEEFTREIQGNSTANGTSNSNSNSNSSSLGINNNTPQQRIQKQNLESGIYASNVSQTENTTNIDDTTNTNSSAENKTVEKYTRHEEGDNGVIITNQRLVKEYREIIVAIDEEIINELAPLFMGIY